MGYSTQYALKVTNLSEITDTLPVSIESVMEEIKNSKLDKEVLLAKLQMIKDERSEAVNEEYIINVLRNENENAEYALDESGDTVEGCKWYEHEEELKSFSKRYPNWLFTLEGIGEESPDVWKRYFVNGKVQVAKGIITFDEFNFNKLK